MYNFFTNDLFFVHATVAAVAFRGAARVVPGWMRQLLLILISVYFLTWLSSFRTIGPLLAVYVLTALALGQILLTRATAVRPLLVTIGCAGCVAVLVLIKYHNMLPDFGKLHKLILRLGVIEWIGLSYLTFRTIDYLINVRPAQSAAGAGRAGWLYGCSYLLFFPGYVSGPINRYRTYCEEQAKGCTPLTFVRIRSNLLRISLGIVKILLLGRLAYSYSILAPEFPALGAVGFPALAVGLYAAYLYYYFDFAGYCDVAIALADFFEVRLPENFDRPFLASNPQDFWNRWHVTLTHWLRDFVFFRLLRFFTLRLPALPELAALMVSSFVTFALMGAWHGSALNWLLYGCYHGLALCLHLVYRNLMEIWLPDFYERLRGRWDYRGVCVFLTFNYVAWGLLLTLPLTQLRPLLARLIG